MLHLKHQSATTFRSQTGEVNNADYLATMVSVKGWDGLGNE